MKLRNKLLLLGVGVVLYKVVKSRVKHSPSKLARNYLESEGLFDIIKIDAESFAEILSEAIREYEEEEKEAEVEVGEESSEESKEPSSSPKADKMIKEYLDSFKEVSE